MRWRECCRHDRGEVDWESFILGFVLGAEVLFIYAVLRWEFIHLSNEDVELLRMAHTDVSDKPNNETNSAE